MSHSKEDKYMQLQAEFRENMSEIARLENENDMLIGMLQELEDQGLDRRYMGECAAEGVDGY